MPPETSAGQRAFRPSSSRPANKSPEASPATMANVAPTLLATPLAENTSCNALDVPLRDSAALPSVQACAGRLGAADVSPSGAIFPRGGPSEKCSTSTLGTELIGPGMNA